MTPLWPNLGFERIGELDYIVVQYDAEWLRCIGKRLQAGEPLAGAPRCEQSKVVRGPRPLEWNIGQCLLDLGNNAAALRELNNYSDRSAQTRELNMAVHFAARWELFGKSRTYAAKARGEVIGAWKAEDASVKDAWLNRRKEAQQSIENIVGLRDDDANRWSRQKTLTALCADMRIRACANWAQKVKRQRRRK